MIKNNDSFLYDVDNHQKHKLEIINLIKQIPKNSYENISHTDYNLPNTLYKAWFNYFIKNVFFSWKEKFSDLTGSRIHLSNAWFQWYEKNDFHSWHIHGATHFTNIYYLSLPNKDIKTKIKNFDQEKNFDVSEGQILTIPAFWEHKSPLNIYDEPKIIISFNAEIKQK